MNLKAVIFDFDGVCIDTERARFRSWQMIYESYGFELPRDEWIKNIGTTSWVSDPFTILEKLTGKTLSRDKCNTMHRVNEMEIANSFSLQPGLTDRLNEARERGIPCAVASSSSHRWVDGHLIRRGIKHFFTATVCKEDTMVHKPDPRPYLLALERLHAAAADTVAIEDSPVGIASARAAGIYCIAVPCSMTKGMDFSAAQRIVGSLEEVSFSEFSTAPL